MAGCDDEVNDSSLKDMIAELTVRIHNNDPACKKWCIDRHMLEESVNVSSLATRVSLEPRGAVVEDACHLCIQ